MTPAVREDGCLAVARSVLVQRAHHRRGAGSRSATSESSTSSGMTGGCSATGTPEPIYRNRPGPISRGTLWSRAGRLPTTPDLAEYWARRRRKVKPPLDAYTVRLLTKQDGRCTLCGENLLIPDQPPQSPEGWEWWLMWVTKKAIKVDYLVHHTAPNAPRGDRTHLVHASCSRTGKTHPDGERGTPCCNQRPEPPSRPAWAVCRDEWHARS
jgi:hypothetical protein